ncbi:hypothetical protein BDF21DRAFT_495272 [Thamnidium elegans]|nr:hypothetical protein BDF21DRAFT_495272 [Thamnidium elegans]
MTIEQVHSTKSNSEVNKVNPRDIGLIFAREYYTFLNKKPNRLHAFYGADSLLVRGDEGEPVPMVKGQEEIRKKIEELDFDNCKVLVTQVDSQVSANEGVLISVLGEITNKDQPSQKFTETFFLAPQPNGYYVLNNIFRFLKDKVDINYYSCEEEEVTKELVNSVEIPQTNGKSKEVETTINAEEVPKIKKVTREVTEDPHVPSSTVNINHVVLPVATETNKQHYYKDMSNNYNRDQRTFQKPIANKSWATLAASNANEALLDHHVDDIKPPPSQQQQQQYYPHQKPEALTQQNYTSSLHALNNVPHDNNFNHPQQQQQQQQQQQHPNHHQQQQLHQQQNQQQNQQQSPMQYHRLPYQNKDQRIKDTQIFVKNVTSSMTEEQLGTAFNQFGTIKTVSISQNRTCAFIEFESIDSTHRALEHRKVTIGTGVVIAEERRPPKNRNTFDNNRRFQQNRRGSTNAGGLNPSKRGTGVVSNVQK